MRDTVTVADDVYDIPDREAMRATAATTAPEQRATDDYYDPSEAAHAISASGAYYNMTYNDPYYYNYGRFGFGTDLRSFGPGFGMGMSYGWPTNFGIGYATGFGGGYGYNPYWGNPWMIGGGYGPYGYYPYGYYHSYGPYQGLWGGCSGCYEPSGYGQVINAPRPSMSSSSMQTNTPGSQRMMRNPASLLPNAAPSRNLGDNVGRSGTSRPSRTLTPERPTRTTTPTNRPSRNWDSGISTPSRSGGGNMGGGRISSPRPR